MAKGALLVNSGSRRSRSRHNGRGGSRSKPSRTRAARTIPLQQLFAAMGGLQKNPLVQINPLLTNQRLTNRGRKSLRKAARRAPRQTNGRFMAQRRTNSGRRARSTRRTNSGRGRKAAGGRGKGRRSGRRHANPAYNNPLMVTNRRSRSGRRHAARRHNGARSTAVVRYNPGVLTTVSNAVRHVPVIGRVLQPAVIGLTGAAFGGLLVAPSWFAMKWVGPRLPDMVKPVAYSLVGALLSGVAQAFIPSSFRHKGAAVAALAAAGGAVDGYRALTRQSSNLGQEDGYGWDDETGAPDVGAADDEDVAGETGDLGAQFGADETIHPPEWGDASLMDALYSGEDFSEYEMHMLELGRPAFRDAFADLGRRHPRAALYRRRHGGAGGTGANGDGSSRHAGKPGARWGWLAYWIGHGQMRAVKSMPRDRRRATIAQARHAAMAAAKAAIEAGHPSLEMEAMDVAGLLAIHGV